MANTVSGLFPELASALAANPLADAYKPVSDPLAAYTGLISGAGAELRQSIGQAFGQQTPQEQLRSIVQSVQEKADLTTPEGLLQLANEMNRNPQFSGMALSIRQEAAKLAQTKQQQGLETELTQTRIAREKAGISETEARTAKTKLEVNREEELRKALSELPANATDEQLLAVYRKYGTADQQSRAIQASLDRKAKLAASQTEGTVAGYIGKTGAYRNQFGDVITGAEMKKQRENFLASQKLLESLNRISAEDAKNAEAVIDYTASENRKDVASKLYPKTLSAQTKIAASQLLQQLESLPPGSASDADLKLAAKNFPGYGNADNLIRWVNETKALLDSSMGRQAELYGFQQRVKSSGPLDLTKKRGSEPTQAAPAQAAGAPKATKRFNKLTGEVEDI